MRISDWSSDVCSSDLLPEDAPVGTPFADYSGAGDPVIDISITPNRQDCMGVRGIARDLAEIGRASCRERVCQYVSISVVAVSLKKKYKQNIWNIDVTLPQHQHKRPRNS